MATKKKIVRNIILIVLAALIVLLVINSINSAKLASIPSVTLTNVSYGSISSSVNVDGVISSETTEKVFSKLNYPVKENMVEVGDYVNAGDVLCQLDTTDLEASIAQQKAAAGASWVANNQQISVAQTQYEMAQQNLYSDNNSSVVQAQEAVKAAEISVEQAGASFEATASANRAARKTAELSGDEVLDATKDSYSSQNEAAYASYEAAKQQLETAKRNLELAQLAADQQLTTYAENIQTAKAAANSTNSQYVSIANLEQNLADTTITAPISGTITAVYAVEGASPTGVLYVIEDVNHLKIITNIKEYDIPNVTLNDPVEIKSDATGENVYSGVVSKIAPTSTKNSSGETANSTNPEFQTDITVPSTDTGLLIGTKARLDIIYAEASDAFFVSYESLVSDDTDMTKGFVYVLDPKEDGMYTVRAIAVEIGVESDVAAQIISSEITKDTQIVSNVSGLAVGATVRLAPTTTTGGLATDSTTIPPGDDSTAVETVPMSASGQDATVTTLSTETNTELVNTTLDSSSGSDYVSSSTDVASSTVEEVA